MSYPYILYIDSIDNTARELGSIFRFTYTISPVYFSPDYAIITVGTRFPDLKSFLQRKGPLSGDVNFLLNMLILT